MIRPTRSLRDLLIDVRKKYDLNLRELLQEQIDLTIDDLRVNTPKDTGAAAGTEQGSKRPMYKKHPGWGRKIGNAVGDTGWQEGEKTTVNHWAIISPMWHIYLREVNYTHPTNANFVEDAVRRMRERLIHLRDKR